ncbi:MAG: hypothetical protein ABFC18_03265 [Rikenellaceae bacterium]
MKELSKGEYLFSNPYEDRNGTKQVASVVLSIEYRSKNYSIVPNCSHDEKFEFKYNSYEWRMWKAVCKSIDEAIDFANKELKIDE